MSKREELEKARDETNRALAEALIIVNETYREYKAAEKAYQESYGACVEANRALREHDKQGGAK